MSQVVQVGFGPGRIAVTQRVDSCYCVSARCRRLWRVCIQNKDQGPPKEKRRKADKKSAGIGKQHGNSAGSVKNFQTPAMLKTAPLDCEIKRNLREKRRDPWPRANAPPKAVAVPEPVVKTRREIRRRVLTWFAGRWRNHQPKRAEKPHSKSASPKGVGRPCYEAENSACRGEWRREAGSPARARLMPVRERERGELPSPICPGSTERLSRDLLFWGRQIAGEPIFNRPGLTSAKRSILPA